MQYTTKFPPTYGKIIFDIQAITYCYNLIFNFDSCQSYTYGKMNLHFKRNCSSFLEFDWTVKGLQNICLETNLNVIYYNWKHGKLQKKSSKGHESSMLDFSTEIIRRKLNKSQNSSK